ncbi:conserved hypothetical protein [Talaromyces stipitatus ATCC 10500]|uniref:DUF3533 domain-containing protein n=1 Tax=Talaromyces stipitatus (strain ATCC 10500 / CBS 375.48 / QM 6759 / NRRL 1006) TaxID=441959 RepID=B8LT37_TALSN|nr:uncharacterized protein TSTA_069630 [Talaromyces stipitatus ATCC 10500]EED23545.1 conserved hypothetical protein [Talaromyces stipitatus ATCC 10500]
MSFRQAYLQHLQGDGFPTIIENQSRNIQTRLRWKLHEYQAALHVSFNATDHLACALGGSTAALSYNHNNVVIMIWNEARYPATVDVIASSLQILSESARVMYSDTTGVVQKINSTNPAAVAAFSNWALISINIQPTEQGSRLIFNTIVMILMLLQQFFFLATMNGVASHSQLVSRVLPKQNYCYAARHLSSFITSAALYASPARSGLFREAGL